MINPQNPDEETLAQILKDATPSDVSPLELPREEVPLGPRAVMTVITAQLTPTTSKLVLHIKPLSHQDMTRVSQKLKGIVEAMSLPGATAEGDLGLYSSKQWDFMYFGIPTHQLESTRNYIVQQLQDMF